MILCNVNRSGPSIYACGTPLLTALLIITVLITLPVTVQSPDGWHLPTHHPSSAFLLVLSNTNIIMRLWWTVLPPGATGITADWWCYCFTWLTTQRKCLCEWDSVKWKIYAIQSTNSCAHTCTHARKHTHTWQTSLLLQSTDMLSLGFTLLSVPLALDGSGGRYRLEQHHYPHSATCSPKVNKGHRFSCEPWILSFLIDFDCFLILFPHGQFTLRL